jgi:hypothetical protein
MRVATTEILGPIVMIALVGIEWDEGHAFGSTSFFGSLLFAMALGLWQFASLGSH